MSLTVDAIIILFLLMGAAIGFKRGVIKSAVTFIGAILVILLSFYLKNPLSKLMYTYLPFFNFGGDFEGLSVLNIVIYEALAFVIVYVLLMSILQIVISVTGVIEKVLNFTIVLGIPSKILGALFGLVEMYIFVFVGLFLLTQIPATNGYVLESNVASKIVTSSPVLSGISDKYYKAFDEILSIKDQNIHDKDEYNRQSLDILLKYEIVEASSVRDLIHSGKLTIPNAESVLEKYEE